MRHMYLYKKFMKSEYYISKVIHLIIIYSLGNSAANKLDSIVGKMWKKVIGA
jgi:hypothetical protein